MRSGHCEFFNIYLGKLYKYTIYFSVQTISSFKSPFSCFVQDTWIHPTSSFWPAFLMLHHSAVQHMHRIVLSTPAAWKTWQPRLVSVTVIDCRENICHPSHPGSTASFALLDMTVASSGFKLVISGWFLGDHFSVAPLRSMGASNIGTAVCGRQI